MDIVITNGGHEQSWYSKSVGQIFKVIEPPTWALDGSEDDVYYVEHFGNSTGEALFVWKNDCSVAELDLMNCFESNE